ncbi:hypothetical protein [Nakamurella leprariae]|uniref:Uncharacterized protein n=1 Tax=Nakamurella leprariae TaxID=2803911 RepID=A0A938YHN5_9ACTN|nr:hypothetical protein [Nakamurella leprariae]MBM9468532.1 hypothetical protein [Nakamurella leprariae]
MAFPSQVSLGGDWPTVVDDTTGGHCPRCGHLATISNGIDEFNPFGYFAVRRRPTRRA